MAFVVTHFFLNILSSTRMCGLLPKDWRALPGRSEMGLPLARQGVETATIFNHAQMDVLRMAHTNFEDLNYDCDPAKEVILRRLHSLGYALDYDQDVSNWALHCMLDGFLFRENASGECKELVLVGVDDGRAYRQEGELGDILMVSSEMPIAEYMSISKQIREHPCSFVELLPPST